MAHMYILGTILLTVYGQLVIKWQVIRAGDIPAPTVEKLSFLLGLLLNPWIISGFVAAFLASLCWMAAMAKFDLSYAYPFMSFAFVLVLVFSSVFLHETITVPKVVAVALIAAGVIIGSRG